MPDSIIKLTAPALTGLTIVTIVAITYAPVTWQQDIHKSCFLA